MLATPDEFSGLAPDAETLRDERWMARIARAQAQPPPPAGVTQEELALALALARAVPFERLRLRGMREILSGSLNAIRVRAAPYLVRRLSPAPLSAPPPVVVPPPSPVAREDHARIQPPDGGASWSRSHANRVGKDSNTRLVQSEGWETRVAQLAAAPLQPRDHGRTHSSTSAPPDRWANASAPDVAKAWRRIQAAQKAARAPVISKTTGKVVPVVPKLSDVCAEIDGAAMRQRDQAERARAHADLRARMTRYGL